MSSLFSTIIAAALVNNIVFVHLLGVSSLFAFSRRLDAAAELALLAAISMFPALVLCAALDRLILDPLDVRFLNLLAFVFVTAAIATILMQLLSKHFPLLARKHSLAVAMLSCNSVIIGAAFMAVGSLLSFPLQVAYSLGTVLGFVLALMAFAAIRQRCELAALPDAMRGPAIDLICAGIAAMCFLGFAGLV